MTNIKQGFWIDHNRTGLQSYQYLTSERRATTASNIIAVALTLALPRIYILFKRSIPELSDLKRVAVNSVVLTSCRKPSKLLRNCIRTCLGANPPATKAAELALEFGQNSHPEDGREAGRISNGILGTLENAAITEDAVSRLARRHLAMPHLMFGENAYPSRTLQQIGKNFAEDPKSFISILALMMLLFAIYVGLQIIAISSNHIVGDSSAVIKHGACAFQFTARHFPEPSSNQYSTYWRTKDLVHEELTNLAIDYAESCYSTRSMMAHCRDLLTPTLPYNVTYNASCPFPSKDMCKLGQHSGIAFDTGFLNSRLLGLNTRRTLEFRRRTTCVPVNDSGTYIEIKNVSEGRTAVRYKYDDKGPMIIDGDTLIGEGGLGASGGDPSPGQSYGVHITQFPSFNIDGWLHPRLVSNMSSTSLFFIRKKSNVLLPAYSADPIFPATTPLEQPWLRDPLWFDLSKGPTVLGCVDEKYIKDSDSGLEWYILAETLHDRNSNNSWDINSSTLKGSTSLPLSNVGITELRLLALILLYSDSANSVHLARRPWLIAASRVVGSLQSLPLEPNQWQVESRNLFNISLARIQSDLWYMGQERKPLLSSDNYDMLENSTADPCGMIKMKTEGMKNISIVDFLAMLGLVLSLWILTMEINETIILFWLFKSIVKPAIFGFFALSGQAWTFLVGSFCGFWYRMVGAVRTWISGA